MLWLAHAGRSCEISLNVQAELELVEGTAYYAREANADIANAFVSEFERSANLLADFPKLGEKARIEPLLEV